MSALAVSAKVTSSACSISTTTHFIVNPPKRSRQGRNAGVDDFEKARPTRAGRGNRLSESAVDTPEPRTREELWFGCLELKGGQVQAQPFWLPSSNGLCQNDYKFVTLR